MGKHGLKIQEHLFSIRNPLTDGLSTLIAATYKASVLQMKIVPLSERKAVTFQLFSYSYKPSQGVNKSG